MASVARPKTAEIIPFPARRRHDEARGRHDEAKGREPGAPSASSGPLLPAGTVVGSGWYHDAAIAESIPGRKP